MTWTLWRGGEMIGEVFPRRTAHAEPGRVSGVLLARPGVALPTGGTQHRIAVAGQSWVAELPTLDLDGPKGASDSGELQVRPSGIPAGIPPEKQLSIRDAGGEAVAVQAISAHEHRLHREQPSEEVAALPEGAIVNGSVWLVDFRP